MNIITKTTLRIAAPHPETSRHPRALAFGMAGVAGCSCSARVRRGGDDFGTAG